MFRGKWVTFYTGKPKELSFCHKLEFSNPYIFATGWRKPLILQTYMIWSNRNHSLKYLRSMSLGCKDIGIGKSKFVAKTQFLSFDIFRIFIKNRIFLWNLNKTNKYKYIQLSCVIISEIMFFVVVIFTFLSIFGLN